MNFDLEMILRELSNYALIFLAIKIVSRIKESNKIHEFTYSSRPAI